jgi:hypothetical protein
MASLTAVFSHWGKLLEGLQYSPMQFYGEVEAAVRKRQLPDCEISAVDWPEGGVFSAKREYLRIARKGYTFDVCGAPFGTGFFVTWWMAEIPPSLKRAAAILSLVFLVPIALVFTVVGGPMGLLLAAFLFPFFFVSFYMMLLVFRGFADYLLMVPVIGAILAPFLRPFTYYKADTADMFCTAVHSAVQEVIDDITRGKLHRADSFVRRRKEIAGRGQGAAAVDDRDCFEHRDASRRNLRPDVGRGGREADAAHGHQFKERPQPQDSDERSGPWSPEAS